MRSLKIVLLIAAFLAAIFILNNTFRSESETVSSSVSEPVDASSETAVVPPIDRTEPIAQLESEPVNDKEPEPVQLAEPLVPNPDYPELYGYEVGLTEISEAEYEQMLERLRNDPALMQDVLNELRAETDPARIRRLSALLGKTGSAALLPATEELVYSSNPDTRKAALDMLSRLAPLNPEAYGIANSILGSEADADILVSTMNVLARPTNATPEVKATAISQIMPLANHESAAVRRHSVGMLVRLTNDETLSPVLYNALSDSDKSVREAAVYAYAGYPYQTTEAVDRLLEITEDPTEARGVRSGAILALSKMSPDEQMQARIAAAKQQMREALRAK